VAKYTVNWASSGTGACSSCLVTGPDGFSSSTLNSSQIFYKPRGDYKYDISCSGGYYCLAGGSQSAVSSVSSTVTINVVQLPQCTFWADPTAVILPRYSTLKWSCYFADTCSIDNGIGSVSPVSGSKQVRPSGSTTYTLSCNGLDGSRDYQATVGVGFIPWIREILPR